MSDRLPPEPGRADEQGTPTEHEQWLHNVAKRALLERDEIAAQRDAAYALLREMRPVLAGVGEDIKAVLTVYDEHTPPENRGPWRDRLAAWVGADPAAEAPDA